MIKNGSVKILDVGGTEIRVHPTFFLLLVWIGVVHWYRGGFVDAISGIFFILILFLCVVLHEFGHILMAGRFGIHTPQVTLLPIGGVASMERMPEKPQEEILVALAGPLVNLIIVGLFIYGFGVDLSVEHLSRVEEAPPDFLTQVALANLVLFVFNLIPAFPMDGGRVLRAFLTFNYGYKRATQIAASIGQVLAIFLGVLGLIGNPFLILIALFIFLSASGESGYVSMQDLSRNYRARDAMISNFEALPTAATANTAAGLLLRTTQQEFPVLDSARHLRGVLTREALISALNTTGGQTPVLDIMNRDIVSVREDSQLGPLVKVLHEKDTPIVAILNADSQFIGYINQQNLAEFFLIRSAQ
ncbi:MAG: site-2 protease family protein [Hyphomicrobium sp.]